MSTKLPPRISLKVDNQLYPLKLKRLLSSATPKELHMMGNLDLLNKIGIGFCGSRNVTLKGLSIAEDCAFQASKKGFVIISGNARGVDRMVHNTALKHDGETILVLPEGLDHFRIPKELEGYWDWNRILVISEFPSSYPWKTWNAMKRNRTILGLVVTMIVIEAGEKGGTLSAGKDALKMNIPLYVVNREDVDSSLGGEKLIQMGGMKLGKSPHRGVANMEPVFQLIKNRAKQKIIVEKKIPLINQE